MDNVTLTNLLELDIPDRHLRKVLNVLVGVEAKLQADSSVSPAALRKRRERDRKRDNGRDMSQSGKIAVTDLSVTQATLPAPSPSPSLPPSPLSPTPPLPAPSHTPPSAPPPVAHVREATGWSPTPEQIQAGAWFGRRASTEWSEKELKAWKLLSPEVIADGLAVLAGPYTERVKYRRTELLTLLNNWRGEIDRWRNWKPQGRSNVTTAGMSENDVPWFEDQPEQKTR